MSADGGMHVGMLAVLTLAAAAPDSATASPLACSLTAVSLLLLQALKAAGLGVQSLEELSKAGGAAPADPIPPKPTDYCTIMYTSGTTGECE